MSSLVCTQFASIAYMNKCPRTRLGRDDHIYCQIFNLSAIQKVIRNIRMSRKTLVAFSFVHIVYFAELVTFMSPIASWCDESICKTKP